MMVAVIISASGEFTMPPPRLKRRRSKRTSFDCYYRLLPLFTGTTCIEMTELALQIPVQIDCFLETLAIRERFYRTRAKCRQRGDRRFDDLRFWVHNNVWLVIASREFDGGLALRGNAQFIVNQHEIIRQF